MRLIFLLPHLKMSGGVRIILNYAHQMAEMKNEVFVCVENKKLTRYIRNLFPKHPFLPEGTKVKFLHVKEFSDIPKADIVIGDSWKVAKKLYCLDISAKKFHMIQHDERLYHGDQQEVASVYELPMKKIVVATWLKDMLKDVFSQDSLLLLNPTDRNIFKPIAVDRSDNDIRILILDHDADWKGAKEAREILLCLKKEYPNIKVVAFGSRRKDVTGLYDEYHFNLPQNKLAELYSSCDIYLCLSWDEGSGLPSMEAMLCKCSLVTYDNGGSRDYAFDNKTALVAERRNQDMAEEKLRQLITNSDLRKKISEKGHEFVFSMPTYEDQAKIFYNFLIK